MKKLALFGILTLSLFLHNCKKEDSTTNQIEGSYTFTDYYTGLPVPNYEVYILRTAKSLMGAPTYTIDTFTTNAAGNVTFSFPKEENHLYELSTGTNEVYGGFDNPVLTNANKNTAVIPVRKFNHLKITLSKISDKYQRVAVTYTGKYAPISRYEGPFKDTTLIFKSVPETSNGLVTAYLNGTELVEKLVTIPKVDTFEVKLEY